MEAALNGSDVNTSGHLSVSETAAKRVRKARSSRKGRGRSRNGTAKVARKERDLPQVGTLARTKALLLAALRVRELKHRVHD